MSDNVLKIVLASSVFAALIAAIANLWSIIVNNRKLKELEVFKRGGRNS